jgi:hypothetical protein
MTSAMAYSSAIANGVPADAAENIRQVAGAMTATEPVARSSAGALGAFGEELSKVKNIAVGMATGMLAADLTMGIAERVKDAAEQIDTFGQQVLKIQRITGESATGASELVAIFDRFSRSPEQGTTSLIKFGQVLAGQEEALDIAAQGGKRASEYLKELGVNVNDATGHIRPMLDVLLDLADAFSKTNDTTEKEGALQALFKVRGDAAAGLMYMLNQGRAGLEGFIAEVQKYNLTLTQNNLDDVQAFVFAHKDMDLALQGVSLQLGAAFMPAITAAAQQTVAFAHAINQTVMPAIKAIPGALPAITTAVEVLAGVALVKLIASLVRATAAMVVWAATSAKNFVVAVVSTAASVATLTAGWIAEAAAASAAAVATVAAWLAAAGPITLIIGGIVTAAGAITLALSGKLSEAKDALGAAFSQMGSIAHSASDAIQKGIAFDPSTFSKAYAEALTTGTDLADGQVIATPRIKLATEGKDNATANLQAINDAAAQRKADFDIAHVGAEQHALELKMQQTAAEQELLGYKRQIEDIDRHAIDYAMQLKALDDADAVTKARLAEAPLSAKNADIKYQEDLIKAEIKASRAGGPAVDMDAARAQLAELRLQDMQMQPALLAAEHQVTLADRTKQTDDLQKSLRDNATSRAKIGVEAAMEPLQEEVTARQRAAENAQKLLELDKQRFQLSEMGYQAETLMAQAAEKAAAHTLYVLQHAQDVSATYGPPTPAGLSNESAMLTDQGRLARLNKEFDSYATATGSPATATEGPAPTAASTFQARTGATPVTVEVGGIQIALQQGEDVVNKAIEAFAAHIQAAWNAATAHSPVSGQLGGNYQGVAAR